MMQASAVATRETDNPSAAHRVEGGMAGRRLFHQNVSFWLIILRHQYAAWDSLHRWNYTVTGWQGLKTLLGTP